MCFDRRFQKDTAPEAKRLEVPAVVDSNSRMLIPMMTEGHQDVMKRWNCEPDMVAATPVESAARMHCRAHYCYRMRMWMETACCSEKRTIR